MTTKRLLAICLIVTCTAIAWFLLAGALKIRSVDSAQRLGTEIVKNWGPVLNQEHPSLFYESPTGGRARREIQPERSDIRVSLSFDPKQKGLLWYRTFIVDFAGEYLIKNPTPIPQTIYAAFKLPDGDTRYDRFSLTFGDQSSDKAPVNGMMRESLLVAPGAEATLKVEYRAARHQFVDLFIEKRWPGQTA